MRFIKLSAAFFTVALLSTACNLFGTKETARTSPYENDAPQAEAVSEADVRYARENLDLRAVGALLEKAGNPEEFEYLLNSEGVNNLDLNRDGEVDYISVSEFEDRYDEERGISLFSRFSPELIQEIATIIFDREGFRDASGARILLTGNEQLYGDDYYYETNWRDRSASMIDWLFDDERDNYYRSPYYYGNYPDNYESYEAVETPVYLTRIEQIYDNDAAPSFIQTSSPTISRVKIKSPYDGRSVSKNFPKPSKPAKEQKELGKNEPVAPEFVPVKKGKIKDFSPRPDERERGNQKDFEKPRKDNNAKFETRENPNKIRRDSIKPPKVERQSFNQPGPDKVEKQNMKSPKPGNNGKQKGGGDNQGRGNGGGGNKGGGKGGGKKN
jgi:hypothetical protein